MGLVNFVRAQIRQRVQVLDPLPLRIIYVTVITLGAAATYFEEALLLAPDLGGTRKEKAFSS